MTRPTPKHDAKAVRDCVRINPTLSIDAIAIGLGMRPSYVKRVLARKHSKPGKPRKHPPCPACGGTGNAPAETMPAHLLAEHAFGDQPV